MMNDRLELSYSISEIKETAFRLISHFDTSRIFCFCGSLGSGKTTLVNAICGVLGSEDKVSSPTFSLVNEYKTDLDKIYHFDLFRLKNLEEAMDIGFEEYIYSGSYCFIEWPEKVAKILPLDLVVSCELSYLSMTERKLKAWVN